AARLLFREGAAVAALPDVTIWKATLSVPVTGTPADRTVSLRLHPITAAWSPLGTDWNAGWTRAGGDYDEELFATAEVNYGSGTATAVFDVTAILKETLEHGMFADGYLLTVDPKDGAGLSVADLTRFGTLAGATLDVKYRPAFRQARR
ncbi:MAG TPA: hypothetical protein VKU85_03390, partial [bacterium]|nr:hypothetical protein [bacterium]